MKRRRRSKSSSGGIAEWFVTYSDMVTLLLTFIMLYSFSTINAQNGKPWFNLSGATLVYWREASLDPVPGLDESSAPNVDLEQLQGFRKKEKWIKPSRTRF